MVDEGESDLFGEGRSRRVIHCGGEGHEDRVLLKRENKPSDFQECSLVADRIAKDGTQLGSKVFFLVSPKEKLSTRSSRVMGFKVDPGSSAVCAKHPPRSGVRAQY